MRVLYAFQGTGNGHHTRAMEFLPLLDRMADVDVWVSGGPMDRAYDVDVDRRMPGAGFAFGTRGGIHWGKTLKQARPAQLFRDVRTADLRGYDGVLCDFEPISAWAARRQGVPVVSLSHQAAVQHPASPKPARKAPLSTGILRHYAPASHQIGFHFQRYALDIRTPVIRRAVREVPVGNRGHVTVYLPSFGQAQILQVLRRLPQVEWQVFSRHWAEASEHDNVRLFPASAEGFLQSMAASAGVLCGAGFETAAEALFLGKPLLVIPQQGQYEQACNAHCLADMGVATLSRFGPDAAPALARWLADSQVIEVAYPDESAEVLEHALALLAQSP